MSLSMMSISMLTKSVSSSVRRGLAMIALWSVSAIAMAEYRLNFQDPVTEVARDIYSLHMLIFWICVAIFVAVFSVMFYSIFKHRKSKNYEPAKFSHSTSVEIVWTVIPFLILIAMAIPATQVLIKMEDTTKSDLTIKITGYQWKWGYEYMDGSDINFFATLATPRSQIDQFDVENAEPQGENYLLETDNHLVVPSGRKVRALITANDVIHAWWIPAFGSKKDAIPGYINELWFRVDEGKEGIYRGQCAELCGKDHAFMPIVVEVVTGDEFDAWVAAGGSFDGVEGMAEETSAQDAGEVMAEVATDVVDAVVPAVEAAEPVSAKTYTKEELIAKGAEVASNCLACHGADGKGIPGVFPAVAGSAIATGPIEDHIDIVMFGKAGTAMAAFAGQLSDEDIAAVITYQRNSYGNDTGDVVLPSDIKAKRQ
ncbi:MAG: cytochrome c oxidase subunit II [Arenicella sp.]|nr:cytochrome c oxidase subunit II [Arenicella sp.]